MLMTTPTVSRYANVFEAKNLNRRANDADHDVGGGSWFGLVWFIYDSTFSPVNKIDDPARRVG